MASSYYIYFPIIFMSPLKKYTTTTTTTSSGSNDNIQPVWIFIIFFYNSLGNFVCFVLFFFIVGKSNSVPLNSEKCSTTELWLQHYLYNILENSPSCTGHFSYHFHAYILVVLDAPWHRSPYWTRHSKHENILLLKHFQYSSITFNT